MLVWEPRLQGQGLWKKVSHLHSESLLNILECECSMGWQCIKTHRKPSSKLEVKTGWNIIETVVVAFFKKTKISMKDLFPKIWINEIFSKLFFINLGNIIWAPKPVY